MKWFLALFLFAPISGWGQANTALAESCMRHYASHYGVPAELVAAFIDVESRWNPRAVSSKGALGLMQLMHRLRGALALTSLSIRSRTLQRERAI